MMCPLGRCADDGADPSSYHCHVKVGRGGHEGSSCEAVWGLVPAEVRESYSSGRSRSLLLMSVGSHHQYTLTPWEAHAGYHQLFEETLPALNAPQVKGEVMLVMPHQSPGSPACQCDDAGRVDQGISHWRR
jgi:hypothetical protein